MVTLKLIFLSILLIVSKVKFNKKFGLFISKKRLESGLTQSELASLLGNNAQNVSRLERGEVSPTLFWVTILAEAFELTLTQLVEEFTIVQIILMLIK